MDWLGMFAKHWTPGQVKTRLAAEWGDAAAARLYRACLETLLTRFAGVGQRRTLVVAPHDRRDAFQQLAGDTWRIWPQGEGDLGQRMERFFRTAFAEGAQRAVLIGSDSPTLPRAYVERAFEELLTAPVVLGPARDGGYYLIGLRPDIEPPLFEDIPWSTDRVWPQSIARLSDARIGFATLPEWYDVDTPADLRRLRFELTDLRFAEEYDGLRDVIRAIMSDPG